MYKSGTNTKPLYSSSSKSSEKGNIPVNVGSWFKYILFPSGGNRIGRTKCYIGPFRFFNVYHSVFVD